jgi:hypothetical protein
MENISDLKKHNERHSLSMEFGLIVSLLTSLLRAFDVEFAISSGKIVKQLPLKPRIKCPL